MPLLAGVLLNSSNVKEWFTPSRDTATVNAFKLASPAVVKLEAELVPGRRSPNLNQGSGIIINPDGFILTNEHLVQDTQRIFVQLVDGQSVEARLWGSEPSLDLAVLKIEAMDPLPFIPMGVSRDLMIGEDVILIGNSLGKGLTCTKGIISALNRAVQTKDMFVYKGLIQTDAAMNRGNSGGPLLNIRGELIGITTALKPGAEGVGFAIPIDRAREVVETLIEYQYVPSGWVGISVENLAGAAAAFFQRDPRRGVFVSQVMDGGPASGILAPGDIIESIGGQTIDNVSFFISEARDLKVHQQVDFSIVSNRDGERRKVKVIVEPFPEWMAKKWAEWNLGILVDMRQWKARIGNKVVEKSGVLIIDSAPRSPLNRFDQLVEINREKIETMEDFKKAIVRVRRRRSIPVTIERHGHKYRANILVMESGKGW